MQERQLKRLDSLKKALDKITKAKSLAKECEICHKEFGLLRFKHFCARCTRIICADCGENKRLIWTCDHTQPRRVCFDCEKEDKFQELFRELNKTSWGCQSLVGLEWRKKCELSLEDGHPAEANYFELLKLANTSPEGYQDFLSIEKDVMRGRSDRNVFNPSIREFLFHNQGNLDTKKVQIQICNVLKAFCVSHPFIGYCQGMNYIVAFLLSLMDEESAYLVFTHVVTRILPKNYYGKPHQGDSLLGLQQEKFVIVNLAKDHFKLDDQAKDKVDYFLDIYSTGFMIPLFVDYFNYEVLFSIWKRLIYTQSMNEIRKIALHIIGMFLEQITKGNLEKSFELRNHLITGFTIDSFHQAQTIQIDSNKVYQLEEEFKQDYASKWISNKNFVYSLLQRHTHFSKTEIQALQEQYMVFMKAHAENGETSEPTAVRGVNKEQFMEIVNHVIKEDHEALDYVETLHCDQIFEVFDLDDTGYLDFKELVFCLSMLIRGSLDEKIEFAFQVFDKEEKGYLEPDEYKFYVRSLIKASKMVKHNKEDPVFDKELAQFETKLLGLAKKGDAEVKYGDIHNALLGDTFIQYCHNLTQPKEAEPVVSIIDEPEVPTEVEKKDIVVEKKE